MINQIVNVDGALFQIEQLIGRGMNSTVYGGRDLQIGRPVAIKIIQFDSVAEYFNNSRISKRELFWKELNMLLMLQDTNPQVIRVFNYDYNDTYGIIVMERGHVFRDTISHFVQTGTPMPLHLIQIFWSQMVEAIAQMHQLGIVHGDCKPENFIQVGPQGKQLKLIDMGISFPLPPNVTSQLKTMIGTPDYVSPEMVNTRQPWTAKSVYGYKADVWALGIILFEMAFGYRPLQDFGGKRTKLRFLEQLRDNIEIPNHPNRNLRDIVKKCLRVNPRRRISIDKVLNHSFLTTNLE